MVVVAAVGSGGGGPDEVAGWYIAGLHSRKREHTHMRTHTHTHTRAPWPPPPLLRQHHQVKHAWASYMDADGPGTCTQAQAPPDGSFDVEGGVRGTLAKGMGSKLHAVSVCVCVCPLTGDAT